MTNVEYYILFSSFTMIINVVLHLLLQFDTNVNLLKNK